ncbi:MAG: hypothetical protein Kow0075_08530 [Salibacteraceae bacterium]
MTNSRIKLALHIGYAKCATTYLQKEVFPNLVGINYLGRYYPRKLSLNEFSEKVCEYANGNHDLLDEISKRFAQQSDGLNFYSNEVILRPSNFQTIFKNLAELRDKVGKTALIISIRNQSSLIFSRYMHDLSKDAFRPYKISDALDFNPDSACNWPSCNDGLWMKLIRKSPIKSATRCYCNQFKVKRINVPYYNYNQLLELALEFFDRDQIHFIVSEQLKTSPIHELKRLYDFLNIPSDFIDQSQFKLGEDVNQRNKDERYLRLHEAYREDGIHQQITDYFKADNATFAKRIGVNLTDFGY